MQITEVKAPNIYVIYQKHFDRNQDEVDIYIAGIIFFFHVLIAES